MQILEPHPRKLTFTPGNGYSKAEVVLSLTKPNIKKTFTENLEKVPMILKSFNKSPRFGSNLEELLPTENKESSDAVAAFLLKSRDRRSV